MEQAVLAEEHDKGQFALMFRMSIMTVVQGIKDFHSADIGEIFTWTVNDGSYLRVLI